jgi:VWFA-related protein
VVEFEEESSTSLTEDQDLPAFRGELDVSLIGLFVSVVDSKRQPVAGLTKDDFILFENGEPVEITNFEAIVRQDLQPLESGETAPADPESPEGRYVAVLFDNPSLEVKTRKRVLKALEEFIEEGLERNDQFLFAVNSGELDIVRPFTSDEVALKAALKTVAETPAFGDSLKKRKRYLKRDVYSAEILRSPMRPGDTTMNSNTATAVAVARRLLIEIENTRALEYNRINQALMVTDELLRSLAGVEGRKAVIWIGEDLALRPALDIYNVYYSRVMPFSNVSVFTRSKACG